MAGEWVGSGYQWDFDDLPVASAPPLTVCFYFPVSLSSPLSPTSDLQATVVKSTDFDFATYDVALVRLIASFLSAH